MEDCYKGMREAIKGGDGKVNVFNSSHSVVFKWTDSCCLIHSATDRCRVGSKKAFARSRITLLLAANLSIDFHDFVPSNKRTKFIIDRISFSAELVSLTLILSHSKNGTDAENEG